MYESVISFLLSLLIIFTVDRYLYENNKYVPLKVPYYHADVISLLLSLLIGLVVNKMMDFKSAISIFIVVLSISMFLLNMVTFNTLRQPLKRKEIGIRTTTGNPFCYNEVHAIDIGFDLPERDDSSVLKISRHACDISVCKERGNCCDSVLSLNLNDTRKISGSLNNADCMILLADKCTQSNDIDKVREFSEKFTDYIRTLGDGSYCKDSTCFPNQLSLSDINSDDANATFDMVDFSKDLSKYDWSHLNNSCEICDTTDVFKLRGPLQQMKRWVTDMLNRAKSLPPVCTMCVKTVGDVRRCLLDKNVEDVFSRDPALMSNVKYALNNWNDSDLLDNRSVCSTNNAHAGCLNVRIASYEDFSTQCIQSFPAKFCK